LTTLENFNQDILDFVPAAIAVIDYDGVIVAINEQWRQHSIENSNVLGQMAAGTDVGANYLSACQPSKPLATDEINAYQEIRAVLDGKKQKLSLEYPCHSPTQQKWFRMDVMQRGVTPQGGAVVMHTDITERKLDQQALESTLNRIEKIASRVPGVIYQYRLRPDGSSCFPYASEAIRNIYGISPEEVREDASKVFAVIYPDDFDALLASMKKSAKDMMPWQHEYRVKSANGTIRWLLGNAIPQRDADGSVLWHGYISDISEQKQLELERTSAAKRLEELSRHLVSTQEEIRRRLSGELHDRTSPNLAAIDINMKTIAAKLPRAHPTDLDDLLEDTRALIADTTASIRDFCAEIRSPLLDYAGLSTALYDYVQQFAKRTGIAVQFDCTNQEFRLSENVESLLFRIAQEALTNSMKHARATSIRVTLKSDSAHIALAITDNGAGLDLGQLGRSGSIGLGIINMREMAEVAGGKFTIESALNSGTHIAVVIPN